MHFGSCIILEELAVLLLRLDPRGREPKNATPALFENLIGSCVFSLSSDFVSLLSMTPSLLSPGPIASLHEPGSSALAPCLFFSADCSHRCGLPQIQRAVVFHKYRGRPSATPVSQGHMVPCGQDLPAFLTLFPAWSSQQGPRWPLCFSLHLLSFFLPQGPCTPCVLSGAHSTDPWGSPSLALGLCSNIRLSHLSALCKEEPHSVTLALPGTHSQFYFSL